MNFSKLETDLRYHADAVPPVLLLGFPVPGVSLFTHPLQGIWRCARLYTLQALDHVRPQVYRKDRFFLSRSQDRHTSFSFIYAAFIRQFSLFAAEMALLLASCVLRPEGCKVLSLVAMIRGKRQLSFLSMAAVVPPLQIALEDSVLVLRHALVPLFFHSDAAWPVRKCQSYRKYRPFLLVDCQPANLTKSRVSGIQALMTSVEVIKQIRHGTILTSSEQVQSYFLVQAMVDSLRFQSINHNLRSDNPGIRTNSPWRKD